MIIAAMKIVAKKMSPITMTVTTISVERVAPGPMGVALCVGVVMAVTEGVGMAGNTPSTVSWMSADCSVPSILQVYFPESDS